MPHPTKPRSPELPPLTRATARARRVDALAKSNPALAKAQSRFFDEAADRARIFLSDTADPAFLRTTTQTVTRHQAALTNLRRAAEIATHLKPLNLGDLLRGRLAWLGDLLAPYRMGYEVTVTPSGADAPATGPQVTHDVQVKATSSTFRVKGSARSHTADPVTLRVSLWFEFQPEGEYLRVRGFDLRRGVPQALLQVSGACDLTAVSLPCGADAQTLPSHADLSVTAHMAPVLEDGQTGGAAFAPYRTPVFHASQAPHDPDPGLIGVFFNGLVPDDLDQPLLPPDAEVPNRMGKFRLVVDIDVRVEGYAFVTFDLGSTENLYVRAAAATVTYVDLVAGDIKPPVDGPGFVHPLDEVAARLKDYVGQRWDSSPDPIPLLVGDVLDKIERIKRLAARRR